MATSVFDSDSRTPPADHGSNKPLLKEEENKTDKEVTF